MIGRPDRSMERDFNSQQSRISSELDKGDPSVRLRIYELQILNRSFRIEELKVLGQNQVGRQRNELAVAF